MWLRIEALMWIVVVASCSLDSNAVRPGSAGRPRADGAVGDARSPDSDAPDADGSVDSAPSDVGVDSSPVDTGPADTGPADTSPPDTAPVDTGPRPSCDSLYSGAGFYHECIESETSCEFYINPPGDQSCDAVCASGGGVCLDAWRESGFCGHNDDRDCDFPMDDMICLCSR